MRIVAACAALLVIASCFPYSGHGSATGYVLNQTADSFVVRIGGQYNSICHRVPPDSFGQFYSAYAATEPGIVGQVRFYREDGTLVASDSPVNMSSLFVIEPPAQVRQLPISNKTERGLPIVDMPEFPEIDGHAFPDELSEEMDLCNELMRSP